MPIVSKLTFDCFSMAKHTTSSEAVCFCVSDMLHISILYRIVKNFYYGLAVGKVGGRT